MVTVKADDDEVEGTIALDGEDLLFHSAMDEFLEVITGLIFCCIQEMYPIVYLK